MKYKKITIPIFKFNVIFVMIDNSTTQLEIIKKFEYKADAIPELDEESSSINYVDAHRATYVFFNKKTPIHVLVHEIVHVVDYMFAHFLFSLEDTELRAYLVEYIYEKYIELKKCF